MNLAEDADLVAVLSRDLARANECSERVFKKLGCVPGAAASTQSWR